MKAITIHQPWASAIVASVKACENRSWRPPADLVGSWIGIHAGQQLDRRGVREIQLRGLWPGMGDPHVLPFGALLGAARIGEVLEQPDPADPWQVGPLVWIFSHIVGLRDPLSLVGRQRVWNLPDVPKVRGLEQYINKSVPVLGGTE